MPATEPDEPELPLWPEPGTEHGGPAAAPPPAPAGGGGGAPAPPPRRPPPRAPAAVPPAPPARPGPPPPPVPPGAGPSRWDDRARRRQYDRGELHASGDRLGLARPSPARLPDAAGPPASGTRSRLLTTRFLAEGLRRLDPGTAPEREGGT